MNEQLTSTITWLPVNGAIPPVEGQYYMVTDGERSSFAEKHDEKWYNGNCYISLEPTHYAELPTLPTSH